MFHKTKVAVSLSVIISLLVTLFWPSIVPNIATADTSSAELATRAVRNNYQLYRAGSPVDDGWGNFSAYDAYVLAEAGAQLDSWVYGDESFKTKVLARTYATLAEPNCKITNSWGQDVYAYSSKLLAQHLLAAQAFDETEKAAQLLQALNARQAASANGSFDGNPFSDIPALDLLGRGRVIDQVYDPAAAINYVLDERDVYTGAWTSSWNDVMATAQAVRALEYLREYASPEQAATVTGAIYQGLAWLQARQQANGSFQDDSGWDDPAVDTAEIISTLKLLGIDPASWVSSEGKSPVDYMEGEVLNQDGTFGSCGNIADNTWVLDAYLMLGGQPNADAALDVTVSPAVASVAVGETRSFTATAYKVGGGKVEITDRASWSVLEPSIAAINDGGVLTGIAQGSTEVTASYENLAGRATVTVTGTLNPGTQTGETPQAQNITVNIAVVGKAGNLLFGPGSVTISSTDPFGLTAMGALAKTGLSWEFSQQWDGFIVAIAGERNEGMNGWCYTVNGNMPSVLARDRIVSENDNIIFWYSTSAPSSGPKWEDLNSGRYSQQEVKTTTISPEMVKAVKETVAGYRNELAQVLTGTRILNAEKVMSKSEAEALKKELDDNQVSVTVKAGAEESVLADARQEVSLFIPAKALTETVDISVKELTSSQVEGQAPGKIASSLYEFGPSGTKFALPVNITIKVPITEEIKLESLTPAWYDESKKEWIPIPGVIDAKKGLAFFETDHFTKFAVIELKAAVEKTPGKDEVRVTFPDLGEKFAWARPAIESLAAKGLVRGTGRGFEPGRPVTRAEFAAMVANALSLTPNQVAGTYFKDVRFDDWYAGSIGAAWARGLVAGYGDGSFRPTCNLTRNEMACILARLPKMVAGTTPEQVFIIDMEAVPVWAQSGVVYVLQHGLMRGHEDHTFRGAQLATRAEAAVVVHRYLTSCPTSPDMPASQ